MTRLMPFLSSLASSRTSSQFSEAQLSLDASINGFSEGATDTFSLASMALSSFAGRIARVGILSAFSRTSALGGPLLNFISHLGSVAAEAATMTALSRNGSCRFDIPQQSSASRPAGWWGAPSLAPPVSEFFSHFINFGIFRLMGEMGTTNSAPTQHLIQSLAMMAGHHATAFVGLEENTNKSLSQQFLEANLATLQISMGSTLSAHFTGGRIQRVERNLEREGHLISHLSSLPSSFPHILSNASEANKRNEAPDVNDVTTSSTRTKDFNIQEAAFPVLDLNQMSETEITRRLFARSFHSQLFLIKRMKHADSSILADFQEMARYQGCSIQDFFIQNGENIYRYFSTAQDIELLQENPFHLSERIPFHPSQRDPTALRADMRFFLDLAFHSRVSVAPCLFMAKIIAAKLGMNWREMMEEYQTSRGPYEQHGIEVISAAESRLSFDQYFDQMMYAKERGVYMNPAQSDLIGAHSGLFRTPSEYPPTAAFLIRGIYEAWIRQNCPDPFEVVEMGAGNGTLARNMFIELDELANKGDQSWQRLRNSLYYHIVERSPMLQEHQRENLRAFEDRCRFHLASAFSDPLPDVDNGVFLSVELLDMLPPTQITYLQGDFYEVHISSRGGLIQEELRPPRPELASFLQTHKVSLQEGQRFFVHLDQAAWLENIRRHLKQGEVISIDYGGKRDSLLNKAPHRKLFRRFGGRNTIYNDRANPYLAYLGQTQMPFYSDPLDSYNSEATGLAYRADMTVDVDFSALGHSTEMLEGYEGQNFMNLYDYALSVCARPGQVAPAWGNWGKSRELYHGFWTHTIRLGPT